MPAALMLLALAADLTLPANYRDWVFLSSGLGMTYGTNVNPSNPRFDNVFVNPDAWREFKKTGQWPDGATFILEIRFAATEGSINKGGHYQTGVAVIEASQKKNGVWSYYDFGPPTGGVQKAAPLPRDARCYSCHGTNTAVEWTFVQFYPAALEIAKKKGTLKPGFAAAPAGH